MIKLQNVEKTSNKDKNLPHKNLPDKKIKNIIKPINEWEKMAFYTPVAAGQSLAAEIGQSPQECVDINIESILNGTAKVYNIKPWQSSYDDERAFIGSEFAVFPDIKFWSAELANIADGNFNINDKNIFKANITKVTKNRDRSLNIQEIETPGIFNLSHFIDTTIKNERDEWTGANNKNPIKIIILTCLSPDDDFDNHDYDGRKFEAYNRINSIWRGESNFNDAKMIRDKLEFPPQVQWMDTTLFPERARVAKTNGGNLQQRPATGSIAGLNIGGVADGGGGKILPPTTPHVTSPATGSKPKSQLQPAVGRLIESTTQNDRNDPNERRRLLATAAEKRRQQTRKGGYKNNLKNKRKSKKNKKYNRN